MKILLVSLTLHKKELSVNISKKVSVDSYDEINGGGWWCDTFNKIFESVYSESHVIIESVGFIINCDFIEPPYKDKLFIKMDEDNVYRSCDKSDAHYYISIQID
jgi:hypothetical protein